MARLLLYVIITVQILAGYAHAQELPKFVKVLIIGGGIGGLSTLDKLAEKNITDVS